VPTMSGYLRKRVNRAQAKGVKAYKKQWYELKSCILCYWKDRPELGEKPAGDIRMDMLQKVVLDGQHMILSTGDQEVNLLAPTEEESKQWIDALDQSTMRGIIQADGGSFESAATNQAKREAYLSPYVAEWDTATPTEREKNVDEIFGANPFLDNFQGGLDHDGMEELLGESFVTIEAFCDVLDDIISCLPRRDDAFEWFLDTFHKRVVIKVENFVNPRVKHFDQGTISLLMSWLYSYEEALDGVNGEDVMPKLYDLEAIDGLLNRYVDVMVVTMRTWATNLCEIERSVAECIHDGEGCHTNAPVDMFKMVNQQIGIANSTGLHKVAVRVCDGLVPVFDYLQTTISRQIRQGAKVWELDYLCAMVNDGAKYMELLDDLQEQAYAMMPQQWADRINFDECMNGFLKVSATAAEAIAASFFIDMAETTSVMLSDEWFQEKVMDELLEGMAGFWDHLYELIPGFRYVKQVRCRPACPVVPRHPMDLL
jgi:hypothetical protein